ncbi:hypothetical protein VD0002_g9660 [Verticillium dahliae]|nr:hypothetical protein VD0002_g9660 [Verticillium dahliae]
MTFLNHVLAHATSDPCRLDIRFSTNPSVHPPQPGGQLWAGSLPHHFGDEALPFRPLQFRHPSIRSSMTRTHILAIPLRS